MSGSLLKCARLHIAFYKKFPEGNTSGPPFYAVSRGGGDKISCSLAPRTSATPVVETAKRLGNVSVDAIDRYHITGAIFKLSIQR